MHDTSNLITLRKTFHAYFFLAYLLDTVFLTTWLYSQSTLKILII